MSPDGKQLASADDDGSIRLWDMATGKQSMIKTTGAAAMGVAFSEDGKFLAAAGSNGLLLWKLTPDRFSSEGRQWRRQWRQQRDAGCFRAADVLPLEAATVSCAVEPNHGEARQHGHDRYPWCWHRE